MSDQKREELKAKINEKLDKLPVEELEKIVGGGFLDDLGNIIHPVVEKAKSCPKCGQLNASSNKKCIACRYEF